MNLKNKVVIVTGASAGIGEATARALAKKGARVALVARSKDRLAKLEKELPGAFAVVADMSDPAEIKKMVAAVQKHYADGGTPGRIDALVNNAGRGLYGPVETINLEDYVAIMKLNVTGPLTAMQTVIPIMREQKGGIIVNVSSMVSKNNFPYLGGYASTKYALNALSLTARAELAKDGIVVTVVHPGLTATDFGKSSVRAPDMEGMVSRQWRKGADGKTLPDADSPELVAEKIVGALEAGKDGPAEVMWK